MSTTAVQIIWALFAILTAQTPAPVEDLPFSVGVDGGEAIANLTIGCGRCDWGVQGREAAVLILSVDGRYSQHLVLTRGEEPAKYRVMLGPLTGGPHRLRIDRDRQRSAAGAGDVAVQQASVQTATRASPAYEWLSRAPILRARPGTVEHFSDMPLVMYAEQNVAGESGSHYQLQYTVIFTNEDGGTPTDRLMATWGRTTDIEFIYGLTDGKPGAPAREEIQAAGHKWITFSGPRLGSHPIVWVATDNNMVADHGADDLVTFAPAPQLVALDRTSRESVMDDNPWMYAVTSAEMVREGRIDPNAVAGSGKIVDPRRYVTLEACGRVKDATLAFDIGFRPAGTTGIAWLPTDTDPKFRIARGGCFRGGAPVPAAVTGADIAGLRIRAYTRPAREGETPLPPGSGSVVLEAVTKVFMLDKAFVPAVLPIKWTGSLTVPIGGAPTVVPIGGR
jgi:hypothetical protein